MPFAPWNAFAAQFVPDYPARLLLQCQQAPLMRFLVVRRGDVAVKPHFHILFAAANRRGDVNHISPNDGRGMRQSGNRRVPADVLGFLDVPVDGRRRARVNAAGIGTAKLGPVGRGGPAGPKESEEKLCSDCVAHVGKETGNRPSRQARQPGFRSQRTKQYHRRSRGQFWSARACSRFRKRRQAAALQRL